MSEPRSAPHPGVIPDHGRSAWRLFVLAAPVGTEAWRLVRVFPAGTEWTPALFHEIFATALAEVGPQQWIIAHAEAVAGPLGRALGCPGVVPALLAVEQDLAP